MTTEANGVRVITHIIPIQEKIFSPELKETSVKPNKVKLLPKARMFLKGIPMPLGLVQVFTGLIMMSLCTIAILVNILRFNYVLCLGLPFVISGSVAIAAYRRSSSSLIKGTLAMSVICALLAAAGTGYFIWEISTQQRQDHCSERGGWNCSDMVWKFYNLREAMLGLLLALSILELFVCIFLSIFSGLAIQQDESDDDSYSSKSCLLQPGLDSISSS